jgi:hypothetical protein
MAAGSRSAIPIQRNIVNETMISLPSPSSLLKAYWLPPVGPLPPRQWEFLTHHEICRGGAQTTKKLADSDLEL